jgi:hypothetical protein
MIADYNRTVVYFNILHEHRQLISIAFRQVVVNVIKMSQLSFFVDQSV